MSKVDMAKINELVLDGLKLQAIKIYRDQTGVTLQESKAHVDSLETALKAEHPEAFHLPPVPGDVKSRERVSEASELEDALGAVPANWKLLSFESGMGWVATLELDGREFRLINDRGYFESVHELIDGSWTALEYAHVPHQENLSHRMVISTMIKTLLESGSEPRHDS